MLISHKYKFIFIEIPKTGSTSIAKYFFKNLKEDDFLFFRKRTLSSMCWRHCTIQDVLHDFPQCSDYFKFAFVRNPWDRCVSYYSWKRDVEKQEITFEEYIKTMEDPSQEHYIGNNLDFIGKFENFQQDFDTICNKIKVKPRKEQLCHVNQSERKHYTEYYNNETRKIVAEKFVKDIEYFGYKFGE